MVDNTLQRLKGRVAVITGANGGLGSSIARRFGLEGASVVLVDLVDATSLNRQLASEGVRSIAVNGDVSDEAAVKRIHDATVSEFGRVDVLVNVAGITSQGGLAAVDLATWEKVLKTNLTSAFLCCKAFAPTMQRQRYGRIVNITSVLAKNGGNPRPWINRDEQKGAGNVAYGAAKAGLHALTFYLAKELAADGITVNAVAPGPIATTLTASLSQTLQNLIPLGRMGTPEEVADAVAFLAGDQASWITGEVLDVNGGLLTD